MQSTHSHRAVFLQRLQYAHLQVAVPTLETLVDLAGVGLEILVDEGRGGGERATGEHERDVDVRSFGVLQGMQDERGSRELRGELGPRTFQDRGEVGRVL